MPLALVSLGSVAQTNVAAPQGNVSNAELAARSHPAAVAPEQYTQAGAANANLQPLGPAAASDAQPKPEQQQPAAADSSSLVKVVRTAPVAAAAPVQSAGSQPIKSLPLSQMVAGAPGASGASGASGTSPAAKVPPKKAAAAAAKSFEQSEDEKFRQMMEEAEVSPLAPEQRRLEAVKKPSACLYWYRRRRGRWKRRPSRRAQGARASAASAGA